MKIEIWIFLWYLENGGQIKNNSSLQTFQEKFQMLSR